MSAVPVIARTTCLAVAMLTAACSGDGNGPADGSAGAGGASGIACGTITCATGQYCDWAGNGCGGLEPMGTCRARPQTCTGEIDNVCGCNGSAYSNPCVASMAGQDIGDGGGCAAPTGMFACGPRFCMKGAQFCERTPSGMTGVAGTFTCRPLPTSCGTTPTCACIAGMSCANCLASAAGDLTTACPAP